MYAVQAQWIQSRLDLSSIAGNAAMMRITAKERTNENDIVRYSKSDTLVLDGNLAGWG